jgi:hypothetical protein
MSMQSGSTSSTERSSQTYAPWIQQLQQDLAGSGFNMASPFLLTSPFAKAPLNADQRKAFDLARTSGGQVFQEGGPGLLRPSKQNENFLINAPALTGGHTAASMQAARVSGEDVSGLLNPYLRNVMGTATDAGRREYMNADAGLQAKYAAGQALGGSGEALARGQLARGFAADSQNLAAKTMAEGYDNAQRLAMANASMEQQARSANQGAQNAFASQNLDTWLKTPQINSQLMDAQQRRELTAAQAILAGGNQQQAFAQGNINAPWEFFDRLKGVTPQVYDSNRVSNKETESSSSGFDLGSIFKGAAALMGASDERMKTDIQPMGEDPETGLLMYSYRYKGDPKSYPKVVGPMAQDVQKVMPEAVKDMGGRLAIDAGLLSHLSKKKA